MSLVRVGTWTYTVTTAVACGCPRVREVQLSTRISNRERRDLGFLGLDVVEADTQARLQAALQDPCEVCGKGRREILGE